MGLLERIFGLSATPEPLPPYYPLYARRFRWICRGFLRLIFRKATLYQPSRDADPLADQVVLYSNHPSVLDPMLLALLTEALCPQHPVLAAIDATALRRHRYFHGLGFFGIEPSSARGLRRFLTISEQIWTGLKRSCLVITPEGRFSDAGDPRVQMRRGLAFALSRHAGAPIHVVPVALAYRWDGSWPYSVELKTGDPVVVSGSKGLCARSLHETLQNRLQATMDSLRDPARVPSVDLLRC